MHFSVPLVGSKTAPSYQEDFRTPGRNPACACSRTHRAASRSIAREMALLPYSSGK
ncbi:hypothetical protein [Streptomyces sp. NPDC019890]|uniref:hypothetical protein n=1 Tax=Streptomyces sp. NPDC019890 TaxID=3365064 RepID=UPI00384FBE50